MKNNNECDFSKQIYEEPPFCLPCKNLLEFIKYFLEAYYNQDLEQLDFLIDSELSKYTEKYKQYKQYKTDEMFRFTIKMFYRDDLKRPYQQKEWLDFDKSNLNILLEDSFFDDYCRGVIRETPNRSFSDRDFIISALDRLNYPYIEFYTYYKVLSKAASLLDYNRTHILWYYLCYEDLINQIIEGKFYSIISDIYSKYGWEWFSRNKYGDEPPFDALLYKWGYYAILAAKKKLLKDSIELKADLIDLYTEFCMKCVQSEESSTKNELIEFFKSEIKNFDNDQFYDMDKKLQISEHKFESLKQDYKTLENSYRKTLENIKLFQSINELDNHDKEIRILKHIYSCLPESFNDKSPIKGFENIWDQISEETRLDIYQSINLFDLMHDTEFSILALLRSIERELELNFFMPFRKSAKFKTISDFSCTIKKVEKTHIALLKPVTLGTVPFIGRLLRKKCYVESSKVLQAFSEFLGEKQDVFIKICSDMDKYKVGKDSISIINIRNGIAHGDPEITENCDESCYKEVIRLVYEPPIKILFSIIINSMRV